MKNRLLLALSLPLLTVAIPAEATLITIEADDFAAGTDLSTAVPGVTLSAFGTGATFPLSSNKVVSTTPPGGIFDTSITGSRVFGNESADFNWSWYSTEHQFRADFATPTDFVSIITNKDATIDAGDPARVEIYNSSNVLLDSFDTVGTGLFTVSFARGSADIAYMIVRNPIGVNADSFLLDHMVFNDQIPEPSSLVLLGTALTGLCLRSRKRRP